LVTFLESRSRWNDDGHLKTELLSRKCCSSKQNEKCYTTKTNYKTKYKIRVLTGNPVGHITYIPDGGNM